MRWSLQLAFSAKSRGYNAIRGDGWKYSVETNEWNWEGHLLLPSLRSVWAYSHSEVNSPGWKKENFKKLLHFIKERNLTGHGNVFMNKVIPFY